jgi:hypothetical protein
MPRYPRSIGHLHGSIPLRVFPAVSLACLFGTVANYTLVHARWLLLLTVAGWLLIGWWMAWETRADFQRRGAGHVKLRALVLAALVWTVVQLGPMFAHYPALEYRINALVGLIAILYLVRAFAASRPLDDAPRDGLIG